MQEWNLELYRQFEDERTRPAQALLARIPLTTADNITDLGRGPGNSTALLVERFTEARVTGVDTSPSMLASARARLPGCDFIEQDMASWRPALAQDIVFANASLQWVGGHLQLLPRLMGQLVAGGVLAVQMPNNREEPSHRAMREVASRAKWRGRIPDAAFSRVGILSVADYYDLLAPLATDVDIWQTRYYHVMPSLAAIAEWLRATGLRPFLDPLTPAERDSLLDDYLQAIAPAYPPRADGRVLLAFPRLFIVARR
ncbi:trans-aconitate 2-methyltransferase [Sodalis praecaptivus]|uniref:trans-aconitate 2-methyltransferase n=1 Tax=Sodalis praecaptivus TaxID=1239307 RepID=UPI0027EAED61|nr:trans-aconitate 2-methyltransferase [Sodalis praecaptivus]CAJ0999640.1 Trans-aconitate 2-methyltransferase [Sodalis praecaptivus]